MANTKAKKSNDLLIHIGRFLVAIFALLVAATHLGYAGSIGGSSHGAPSGSGGIQLGFAALGLWLGIETIAYTIIAIVYLLGLRTWYLPATLFNAFNIIIYFASGAIAIPGITTMPFGSRLAGLGSLPILVLIVSWLASLIIGIVLLKSDPGSEIDSLLVTKRSR